MHYMKATNISSQDHTLRENRNFKESHRNTDNNYNYEFIVKGVNSA